MLNNSASQLLQKQKDKRKVKYLGFYYSSWTLRQEGKIYNFREQQKCQILDGSLFSEIRAEVLELQ